jgi:hypothetical protein
MAHADYHDWKFGAPLKTQWRGKQLQGVEHSKGSGVFDAKDSRPLIPFPMLSMMLRSGPPVASAAALWITRRKKKLPM